MGSDGESAGEGRNVLLEWEAAGGTYLLVHPIWKRKGWWNKIKRYGFKTHEFRRTS